MLLMKKMVVLHESKGFIESYAGGIRLLEKVSGKLTQPLSSEDFVKIWTILTEARRILDGIGWRFAAWHLDLNGVANSMDDEAEIWGQVCSVSERKESAELLFSNVSRLFQALIRPPFHVSETLKYLKCFKRET